MTDDANRNASGPSRTPVLGSYPGSGAASSSSDARPSVPSPAQGALIGRAFGNYIVDRRLAAGGMGEVYVLRHATLPGRWRVLKVILSSLLSNAMVRERFEREAHAVAQLGDHDNIVGIDDFGTTADGQPWMIMPFVSGKSLDVHLAEHGGSFPPFRVFELLCPIALGVDHAHACGIVHRDLKPSNVFLTTTSNGTPTCKVLDFGIARQMNPQPGLPSTTQHMAVGTPAYMAVEQYEHASDADVTADVYALACMVWEMVTGTPPWIADDPSVLYYKKLKEPPDPPLGKAMPPAWEPILRSAVSVDRTKRPQSVRELVQALAAALPGSPPFVPSGLELLHKLAPKLEERAPDAATLRKNPGAAAARTTPIPAPSQHTTLGSANGAMTEASSGRTMGRSRPSAWRLAGLGLGGVAVAMAITYAATVTRGGVSGPASTPHAEKVAPTSPPPPSATGGSAPATPSRSPVPDHPTELGPSTAATPSAAPAAPTAPSPTPSAPPAAALRSTAPTDVAPVASPSAPPAVEQPHATATRATRPAAAVASPAKAPTPRAKALPSTANNHPPDRTPAPAPKAPPGQKFDPNAVGGQEE